MEYRQAEGWNMRQPEIDELRAEVKLRLDQVDGWKERLRASDQENKRLRREMAKWQADFETEARDGERLRALFQQIVDSESEDDVPTWIGKLARRGLSAVSLT
jgi:hypothetical protein